MLRVMAIQRTGRHKATRLPVEAFLRRRRRLRVGALLLLALILIGLVVADRAGPGLYVTDDWRRYHGRAFEVVRVVDGDTLDLRAPDGASPVTRVRLWGVDTPEMAGAEGRGDAQPLAAEAAALSRRLAEGRTVTLLLERHQMRGRFGRLLAYVRLPDGTLLNARLIEAGFSVADGRWNHSRHGGFERLEAEARSRGVGMWAP